MAAEVEQLEVFSDRIDDEIQSGRIVLAPQGFRLLDKSVARAEKMVEKALAEPFDFTVAESYETDPEKLAFCTTETELAERWRVDLKYRTLSRYLNLLEDAEVEDPLKISAELRQEKELEARDKVRKQYHQYFERLKKETLKDHYDRYLNAFARAFDPHTTYMAPQSKEDFDISMRGSLEGIGATLREEDGYIKVVKVIPGSAADRQGQLHADDVILAVGQADRLGHAHRKADLPCPGGEVAEEGLVVEVGLDAVGQHRGDADADLGYAVEYYAGGMIVVDEEFLV